jgi:apolipoprotein N-acyltransferase
VVSLFVTGVTSSVFVVLGGSIINAWVGSSVKAPFPLLLGLGVWTVLGAAGNALAMFLNGANVVKFQAVCAAFMSISALFAKIAFAKLIGIAGIPWGTVLAYSVFSAVPLAVYVPRLLRTMRPNRTAGARNDG